jgi:hypothetical protein
MITKVEKLILDYLLSFNLLLVFKPIKVNLNCVICKI